MSKLNRIQHFFYRDETNIFIICLISLSSLCAVGIGIFMFLKGIPIYYEHGEIFKSLILCAVLLILFIFFIILGITGLKRLFELKNQK